MARRPGRRSHAAAPVRRREPRARPGLAGDHAVHPGDSRRHGRGRLGAGGAGTGARREPVPVHLRRADGGTPGQRPSAAHGGHGRRRGAGQCAGAGREFYKTGSERQTIFAGEYGEFSAIANQEDPDASLSAQRRVESGEDYLVRVEVSAPEGGPVAGPDGGGLGVPHRLRQDLVDRVGVGNDGVSQEMGAIRESPLHMSVRVTPPQHRPSGFLPPQE